VIVRVKVEVGDRVGGVGDLVKVGVAVIVVVAVGVADF
jgi:hypothetical protein